MRNGRTLKQRLRWRLKQAAAGESRYYGDGGTVHQTGHFHVETHRGTVVAVWFRCRQLPFEQVEVSETRVTSVTATTPVGLRVTGVELREL